MLRLAETNWRARPPIAAHRAAERKYEEENDLLYKRLVAVFPKPSVQRNVEFVGASTHKWRIAALVDLKARAALFETVSHHTNSVVAAAAAFHDIARLENPPRRIAVVKNKDQFGNLINVLSQAGSIMELEAPQDTIRRLAEAA